MPKTLHLAASFCKKTIDAKIRAGGFLFASPVKQVVLFYAGPSREVVRKIRVIKKRPHFSPKPNWKIAAQEATRLNAHRIDETNLFAYLMSAAFLVDLEKFVGKGSVRRSAKMVWDHVSERFSKLPFTEAATLVCGANETSTFRVAEMFGMLTNKRLKKINGRSIKLFRDFRAMGANELFRLNCMTNLLELRAHARASNDNDAKALYKQQREYFLIWRKDEKKAFKAKPEDERLGFREARKEILNRHKAVKKGKKPAPLSAPAP